MKDFKKLLVWQVGMDLVDRVYDLAADLPSDEKYGLRSQITRSATSIPATIAEGSAKRSTKDYMRYLEIALGSAFELETHILVVQRRRWVGEEKLNLVMGMISREQKMLVKFIDKLGE